MGIALQFNTEGTDHLISDTAYGTCSTAAGTAAKVVLLSDFDTFMEGETIAVRFTNSNTAVNPTLNVNGSGAKPIICYGSTVPGVTPEKSWHAGSVIKFVYNTSNIPDGCWTMADFMGDTTYESKSAANGGTDVSLVTTGEKYNWNLTGTRVDNIIAGPTSSAEEVIDIRTGENGTVYPSAGDAVRDQISNLKEDIEDLESNVTHINRFNKANVLDGYYLSTANGGVAPLSGYIVSDYMDISDLTSVKVSNVHIACFYDSNKDFISSSVQSPVEAEYTLTVPNGTKYMRFSVYGVLANNAQVGKNISRSNYTPYKYYTIPNATVYTDQIIDANEKSFDETVISIIDNNYSREHINLFDKTNIFDDTYIVPSNGGTASAAGFFASDYIDISAYSTIKVSKTHLFALYKADKTYLSAPGNTNSINADLTVDVSSASFIRFSTYDEYLDTAQVGKNITSAKYVPYSKYLLNGLVVNGNQVSDDYSSIVIAADGSGDYTSFTEALYDNVDSGTDIFVKAGTYNIVTEYESLFGAENVSNMADADSAIFNGFQYGVKLRNRKIEFAAGAHLVCDWTGHTVDGTHRFSALAVCYNVEIIGLDLTSTHTFYAIHDDYGLWDSPYTVKYENCRIKGINIVNANCIGGGCKPFSRHIINNCYFDNGISDAVVRYHNTNVAGAEPEIYVSNSFFNSKLSFNYYGSQTTKMKAYVNNCKANSIIKAQESISFSTDNVELYKWCCDETA